MRRRARDVLLVLRRSTMAFSAPPRRGEGDGGFASLPCVLGREGIRQILHPALTPAEQEQFDASCARMEEYWQKIKK